MNRPHALPPQAFFHSADQRRELARQRFFDEGVRPTGLVSEAVIQSWSRCLQQRRRAGDPADARALSPLRLQSALRRSRALLAAAREDLPHLDALAASAACHAVLTDGDGIVVHATQQPGGALLTSVARVGLDIGERQLGTTAPAVALQTGAPCTVLEHEHFFDGLCALRCAAAPIRDSQGRIAGVLNLSTEAHPFGFDAALVASAYATAIEHRLAQAGDADAWVLHFQAHPAWVDTPLAALAGISGNGEIRWRNEAAARLLPEGLGHVASLFGLDPAALAAHAAEGATAIATLPGGLPIWWRAQAVSRAAMRVAAPRRAAAEALEPRLVEQQREAIERALKAARGNVSRAARMLGVSRGFIYRHKPAPELFQP